MNTPEQAEADENYEREDEREPIFAKAIALDLPPVYQTSIGCRATKCATRDVG